MQLIDRQYIPVSEYFLHLAHQNCKEELTSSVRAAATASKNPALKGWAFELEQLDVTEQTIGTDPRILVSKDRSLVLPLESGDVATYDGSGLGTVSGDAFTIWCQKWNQRCFDVAFYTKQHLVTMNFTISDQHSLKINPIRDLKEALEKSNKRVSSLTHIAVVEEADSYINFKFGNAEGAGRNGETKEFSVQLARSQKLVANPVTAVLNEQSSYGSLLDMVEVFPREWLSPRKRTKVDYYGAC